MLSYCVISTLQEAETGYIIAQLLVITEGIILLEDAETVD